MYTNPLYFQIHQKYYCLKVVFFILEFYNNILHLPDLSFGRFLRSCAEYSKNQITRNQIERTFLRTRLKNGGDKYIYTCFRIVICKLEE